MPQPSAVISVPISGRREHLVEARALDVQDLALSGRIAWNLRSRPCLARAAGAVTLDDVDLALRRILRLAVGELAGAGVVKSSAPLRDDLARLARGLARLRGDDRLLDDLARGRRVLLEELRRACRSTTLSTMPFTSLETSLSFVCEANDGSGMLHADDRGEPLADVLAREAVLQLLEEVLRSCRSC